MVTSLLAEISRAKSIQTTGFSPIQIPGEIQVQFRKQSITFVQFITRENYPLGLQPRFDEHKPGSTSERHGSDCADLAGKPLLAVRINVYPFTNGGRSRAMYLPFSLASQFSGIAVQVSSDSVTNTAVCV
ncbi:hypothetical protein BaRGS_00004677 [Batillaria attramentaria]|uniref:Uncharacterized protein n=1 Tax=Batillaria attramentaria TaxID=370345 RepID=A0ABD0LWD6_9CAEN